VQVKKRTVISNLQGKLTLTKMVYTFLHFLRTRFNPQNDQWTIKRNKSYRIFFIFILTKHLSRTKKQYQLRPTHIFFLAILTCKTHQELTKASRKITKKRVRNFTKQFEANKEQLGKKVGCR
jgi:hypothetical protein